MTDFPLSIALYCSDTIFPSKLPFGADVFFIPIIVSQGGGGYNSNLVASREVRTEALFLHGPGELCPRRVGLVVLGAVEEMGYY